MQGDFSAGRPGLQVQTAPVPMSRNAGIAAPAHEPLAEDGQGECRRLPEHARDPRGRATRGEAKLPRRTSFSWRRLFSELPGKLATAAAAGPPSTVPAPPATPVEVARLEAELHAASTAARSPSWRCVWPAAMRGAAAALRGSIAGVVAGLRAEADGLEHPVDGIIVPPTATASSPHR